MISLFSWKPVPIAAVLPRSHSICIICKDVTLSVLSVSSYLKMFRIALNPSSFVVFMINLPKAVLFSVQNSIKSVQQFQLSASIYITNVA